MTDLHSWFARSGFYESQGENSRSLSRGLDFDPEELPSKQNYAVFFNVVRIRWCLLASVGMATDDRNQSPSYY